MFTGSTQYNSDFQHHSNHTFFAENATKADRVRCPARIITSNAALTGTDNGPTRHDELDVDQLASAALQDPGDNSDSKPAAQLTSPSSPQSITMSISPAAMFLSSFSSPTVSTPPPDAAGQVVSGYTLGSIIGYGGFSTIRRAFSTSGGVVAVKIVRHSDFYKQGNASLAHKRIQHEAAVWSTLSHEHILPLFSNVNTSYAYFFITLYCPAGSLFDILKRDGRPALPQDDAGMMFRQVVRGLRYLHEIAMFVHRDIKLENVLVDEMGVCRIGDFGMTRKIGELDEDEDEFTQDLEQRNQDPLHIGVGIHRAVTLGAPYFRGQGRSNLQPSPTHSNVTRHRSSTSSANPTNPPRAARVFQPGSLPYAAPELLLPTASGPVLPHPAQDIWALGVLLYTLLTGQLPFADTFEPRLRPKIVDGAYEVPSDIGRGAERVLKGCIDCSVATRWTIGMVDEVAWGVGWGTEGDDVTPDNSDGEFETPCVQSETSASHSCSLHSEARIPGNPHWHQEPRSRPSLEAASRRSSSRMKRSLSRAPVTFDRLSSGRSTSWQSRAPSPSFSALHGSTGLISGSSTSCSPLSESALFTRSSSALERGRRPSKIHSASHSPSPSAVPTTPVDISSRSLEAEPDGELSRGRKNFTRNIRAPGLEPLYSADGYPTPALEILEETADWAAQSAHRTKRSSSVGGKVLTTYTAAQNQRDESFMGWRNGDQAKFPQEGATAPFRAYTFLGSSHHAPVSLCAGENGSRQLGGLRRARSFSGSRPLAPPKPVLTMLRSRSAGLEPQDSFCLTARNDPNS